jgi:hypothetical protein
LRQNEEEYVRLMSDKTKFIEFVELHKQRVAKIKHMIDTRLAQKADNGAWQN